MGGDSSNPGFLEKFIQQMGQVQNLFQLHYIMRQRMSIILIKKILQQEIICAVNKIYRALPDWRNCFLTGSL